MLGAVHDASSDLYVLTAFGGGIISFLSPCVLPIVPGYLSLIIGADARRDRGGRARRRCGASRSRPGLFVLGFTVVFVILGLVTTAVSDALFENQETLTRISGGLVLLMAAYLAGSQLLTTPRLYQEFRFHPHLERFGPIAAPIAGARSGSGGRRASARSSAPCSASPPQGQDLGRATRAAHRLLARARRVVPRGRARVRALRRAAGVGEAALTRADARLGRGARGLRRRSC